MESRAQQLAVYGNFIGGRWQEPASGEFAESRDPATGEVIARIPRSSRQDVEAAVAAARKAFDESPWKDTPLLRSRVLARMADCLERHGERLCRLDTRETGKPLEQSRGELFVAVDSLRAASGMARLVMGRSRINAPNSISMTIREPRGVVAMIVPWNAPIALLFRELAPALAAGNSVIIKPAEYTTVTTAEIVKCLQEVEELPAGIISLVAGEGPVVGAALAESPLVDMVTLTGSVATGKQVSRLAASNLKHVHLELGGKSPNVVFADADVERALAETLKSLIFISGQFCMCPSRLLVEKPVYGDVVERMKELAEGVVVGNGLDPATEMGPIISEKQLERVLYFCAEGERSGTLVTGGRRLTGPGYDRGAFIAPTIFTDVAPGSAIVQEEVFGPVLTIQPFATEAEALALANDTRFGLVAGVWTSNVDRAMRMARGIRAGTVWVNTYYRTFPELEFGGAKESGSGRVRGFDGLHEFTETKHINIHVG